LVALLALPESRASQALRWGLSGLRGSLQAALNEASNDAGLEPLRALLAELEPLLAPCVSVSPSAPRPQVRENETPVELPAASADVGSRLLPLARAVAAEVRFRAALERSPIRTDTDADIWNAVQRLLLRTSTAVAEEWRNRSQIVAQRAGSWLDETDATTVPLSREESIYPGLAGTIQTSGLRSATTAPLDTRVRPVADSGLRFLAGVVSTCLWFIEHDPNLCHCLKSVFRFGVTGLAGDQRERYVSELLRLWDRVCAAAPDPSSAHRQQLKELLKAVLDLDEALQSLMYLPPAAPDSWWGRLHSDSRQAVFQVRDRAIQAGTTAHLQLLGGSFADVNRLAPDSLQVDFGIPGEVAICQRLWARIDGEEIPGRVLYRSPEEGT
jgi:hypothetical protein